MTIPMLEAPTQRRPGLVSVDGRTYPLESAKVTARAEGGLAHSRLTQVFANPHEQALEVVYTMPLPAEGAVLGYTVRVGERVIRGVVEPREKAEAAYQKALAEGRSAGLLEQDRDDTFQQRLGNIPPKTKVEVEVEVLQRLAVLAATDALGAQWEYRFPTVVGIRYEGAPGRVPDAARLDVDRGGAGEIPTRLEVEVTVADPAARRVGSPSHSILCVPGSEGALVRFGEGERLDRDLVLRWPASVAEAGARLLTGGGLAGDDGRYGLVTVTPPGTPHTTLSRDLTVLIDASGSMSGEPIAFAKQVVKELLLSLEPGDQFELLAFADQVRKLTGDMTEATPDSLRRANAALDALEAGGGTEMANAIHAALVPLRHDAQRQVLLVTDGQIGFEREVITGLMHGLPANSRVHAVGIGAAPNRSLTASVARAGRGVELIVNDPVTAREAARRLCAATARPVITEVTIEGTAVKRAASNRLRDVFAGQPLLAAVELRREGGTLEVRGSMAGSAESWERRLEVPAADAAGATPGAAPTADTSVTPLPVGALFGREAIADLELTLAAAGSEQRVEAQIEALGMRHRIACRRTSLVAIAEEPGVDPKAGKRTERIAVEIPAGVSAEGSGLIMGAAMQAPMRALFSRMYVAPEMAIEESALFGVQTSARIASPRDEWRALRELVAGLRPETSGLRDTFDRLTYEWQGMDQAILEKLPRFGAAVRALMEFLHAERTRYATLAEHLRLAGIPRARVDELIRRVQNHLREMNEMAERVERETQNWFRDPFASSQGFGSLRAAIDEVTQGRHAQEYAALVDELNRLVAAEFPEAV